MFINRSLYTAALPNSAMEPPNTLTVATRHSSGANNYDGASDWSHPIMGLQRKKEARKSLLVLHKTPKRSSYSDAWLFRHVCRGGTALPMPCARSTNFCCC